MSFYRHCKVSKMTRTIIYFLLILFMLLNIGDARSKPDAKSSRDDRRSSYYGARQKNSEADTNQKSAPETPRKGGLGAWGYVAIILALICAGMGAYYFTLFYPILCKKERKYDVMELSAV